MTAIYPYFLTIHIIFGSLGLFTGAVNLLRKKGGKTHEGIGKLFVISMIVTGFSALTLSVLKPNLFLFIVGVFTLYLAGTGQAYMRLKKLGQGQKPKLMTGF